MSHVKTTLSVACAAGLLVAGLAGAQTWDRTTYVTFSAPVTLPGVTLPAGTYLFKLADSMSNRHIVQVRDKEMTKIYATILAVAAERARPADETVITFREAPANMPPAVHYWYYPGDTSGHEFVYPKSQAMLIASASGESVLATDAEGADYSAARSAQITRIEPGAEATAARESSAGQGEVAVQTEPRREGVEARAEVDTRDTAGTLGRARALPQTASNVPFVGLIGLLALGGALLTRAVRQSMVDA
jgi:hypothetical protein